MRNVSGMAMIAWALTGCGMEPGGDGAVASEEAVVESQTGGGAEPCPAASGERVGIQRWELAHDGRAVTVCRGLDAGGELVAIVQIVNFEAGARMRVLSEPAAGQPVGTWGTELNKYTAEDWYFWTLDHVSTPASEQLFSVTNSAPFMCVYPGDSGCTVWHAGTTAMSFPQKHGNTITSLGADPRCYGIPEIPGAHGKRLFALGDPYGIRQVPYIDAYDDDCRSSRATVEEELSTYQGNKVSFFDATVGHYPIYGNELKLERRTFIGTRDADGRWGGDQDRAYLLTSARGITLGDAKDILVEDFRAMYTLQLDGGGSTQSFIYHVSPSDERIYYEYLESSDWINRPVPEVLAIYDAPAGE